MPSPLSCKAEGDMPETIDRVISYCISRKLLCVSTGNVKADICCYGSAFVSVGNFIFDLHEHSTGNSLGIYIVDGEDFLCIVRETYWFSTTYTHNDSFRLSGKWDNALLQAMDTIRNAKTEHMRNAATAEEARKKRKAEEENAVKARFETLFEEAAQ